VRTVALPRSLAELWALRAELPDAALFAGGTDLLVRLRQGLQSAPALIGLERVEELKAVREDADEVFLGAGLTFQELLDLPLLAGEFAVLAQAISVLGSPPIRHTGTLGGNLASASPAGDSLPPLYVLGADIELLSPVGGRRLPVGEFILGPGRTALGRDEVIAGVWLPRRPNLNLHHFEKVGARNALAISIASLATCGELGSDGRVRSIRLAWGSVGPTVVRCPAAEEYLTGRRLSDPVLARAGELAQSAAAPISDLRADRSYRLALVRNLPRRLVSNRN
jgi:CO/xanthine dehydrogenase FAD-binding subunit